MNVQPKHWGPDKRPSSAMWHADGLGVVIECEVLSPASMTNRTVYVHLMGEDVEFYLKELRDLAIARRQTPMSEAEASR